MCNALEVARYIIGACPVDNLKLHKLLYYCQAVHLVRNDQEPLFADDIEAWQYGPVVPVVYHQYKKYGFDDLEIDDIREIELSPGQLASIDMTLEYYGTMSSVGLMKRTHEEAPWRDNYRRGQSSFIPKQDIFNYFKDKFDFSDES